MVVWDLMFPSAVLVAQLSRSACDGGLGPDDAYSAVLVARGARSACDGGLGPAPARLAPGPLVRQAAQGVADAQDVRLGRQSAPAATGAVLRSVDWSGGRGQGRGEVCGSDGSLSR